MSRPSRLRPRHHLPERVYLLSWRRVEQDGRREVLDRRIHRDSKQVGGSISELPKLLTRDDLRPAVSRDLDPQRSRYDAVAERLIRGTNHNAARAILDADAK